MLNLPIFHNLNTILCLGAHADDIEIGCGGTILTLLRAKPDLKIIWVVFSAEGARVNEAKQSAEAFLQGSASSQIVVKDFRTSFFPYHGELIKDYFEELKGRVQPDLIFTHFRDDRHQDHRVISDFTWNTFRNHLIWEYEIPKFDGDLSHPNMFVPLEDEICNAKVAILQGCFRTQADKHWFTDDTFLALMRLRGIECASHYAEAFFGRKIIFALASLTAEETASVVVDIATPNGHPPRLASSRV